MTQNQWLIARFQSGKTITSLIASREGITSLPKRISELRKDGHKIKGPLVPVKSRWGRKVRVALYGM